MIEFKNVTKSYGDKAGLSDVNLSIDDGEFVFLVGPSGAGKSTFIKLILKEIDPEKGQIFFPGQGYYPTAETADSWASKRSRHRISGFSASAEKDRL